MMPGMTAGCHPVGAALPPRRDALVTAAAAAEAVEERRDWGMSINVPMARDRMLEFFEREQLPGDVKATLAAALHGDLHYQSLLFTAMIDTWPRLQKAIEEILVWRRGGGPVEFVQGSLGLHGRSACE